MLTLKVVTTGIDGNSTVHLFSGDSITHREYFSSDHCIASKKRQENTTIWIIGDIAETSSEQKFTVSEVFVYDEDRCLKNLLLILPKADCYITDANAKTVDSFFCQLEQ